MMMIICEKWEWLENRATFELILFLFFVFLSWRCTLSGADCIHLKITRGCIQTSNGLAFHHFSPRLLSVRARWLCVRVWYSFKRLLNDDGLSPAVCVFHFFYFFHFFFTLFSRIYYRADDINALHIIGSTPLSPQDFNLFFNFLKTDCYTRRVAFLLRKRCKKMNSSILGVVLQYRYGKIKSVNSILKVALYY